MAILVVGLARPLDERVDAGRPKLGVLLEICVEPMVGVRVQGNLVTQKCGVDVGEFINMTLLLDLEDAGKARADQNQHDECQSQPTPPAGPSRITMGRGRRTREGRPRNPLRGRLFRSLGSKGHFSRRIQPFQSRLWNLARGFVEGLAYLEREPILGRMLGVGLEVVHSVIPFALSACAKVWVAREQ